MKSEKKQISLKRSHKLTRCFFELVDKSQKKNKDKEKSKELSQSNTKLRKGVAPGIKIVIGTCLSVPFKEQLSGGVASITRFEIQL